MRSVLILHKEKPYSSLRRRLLLEEKLLLLRWRHLLLLRLLLVVDVITCCVARQWSHRNLVSLYLAFCRRYIATVRQ